MPSIRLHSLRATEQVRQFAHQHLLFRPRYVRGPTPAHNHRGAWHGQAISLSECFPRPPKLPSGRKQSFPLPHSLGAILSRSTRLHSSLLCALSLRCHRRQPSDLGCFSDLPSKLRSLGGRLPFARGVPRSETDPGASRFCSRPPGLFSSRRTAGRSRGRCRSTVAAARPVSAARRGRRLRGARGGGGGPSLRSIRRRTVNFFSNVLYGAVQPNWPIVGQQNRWFRKNVRPRFCPLHGFPPARRPRAPRTVRLASRALPLCGRLILLAWALALGPLT